MQRPFVEGNPRWRLSKTWLLKVALSICILSNIKEEIVITIPTGFHRHMPFIEVYFNMHFVNATSYTITSPSAKLKKTAM